MSNHFELTMNQRAFQTKPTNEEVKKWIRPHQYNRIEIMTFRRLTNLINKGYSFHAGVLDYEQNTMLHPRDTTRVTGYLNSTCFIPSRTRLLSVDVDHGNMTLDELKACIKGIIPYGMIYKTFSYKEERKKYRILFLANRGFATAEEYQFVQTNLIYLFAHPFRDRKEEILANNDRVDFSAKDPARISFAGSVIEVKDRTFDLDEFIHYCQTAELSRLKEEFVSDWRELKRQQSKSASGKRENSLPKPKGRARKVVNRVDRDPVLDILTEGLQQYGKSHDLTKLRPDYFDTIDFINQIPLTELLSEEIYTLFCCYLPTHDDQNPSANLILDEEGRTRYYCFSCSEETGGHSLSTFDFIEEVFSFYNNQLSRYRLIQAIFELLGVKVYSEYQDEVSLMLRENRRFLREWNYDDPLHQKLQKANLLSLWKEMCEMAEFKCPYKPLTFNREGDYACFFASNRHISSEMRRMGYVGHSDVSKTNDKINRLVKYGLIQKISDEDLDPDFLTESQNYRELLRQQEMHQEGVFRKGYPRRMEFYIIPVVTIEMLEEAERVAGFDKEHRILAKHKGMKQTLTAHGEKKSKSVYVQSSNQLSRKDETFLKHLEAAVERLLQQKGYFTVKQLCSAVDPKGNLIKPKKEVDKYGVVKITSAKSIREHKVETFLPAVKIKKGLEARVINKELRTKYNVPRSITRGMKIYYKPE